MSEDSGQPTPSLLAAIEARLVEEAKAKIARDMAEFTRLASAYPEAVKAMASQLGLIEPSAPSAHSQSSVKQSSLDTLGDLISEYQADPQSPFQKLKHNSQRHYMTLLNLIGREYSGQRLSLMDAATLDAWYAKWRDGGKIAVSHSKMVMLRNLFGFGTMSVRDEDCARLFGLLGKMQIELPKARTEHLTRQQANMIRAKAHEKKRHSIALAQAFQSDAGLKQTNVIGEWAPMTDRTLSDVIAKGMKWVRGIKWDEIDADLVLRHTSGGKEIVVDLKKSPMVMEELEFVKAANNYVLPQRGPVIVSEYDGLPWDAVEFRRWWRRLANDCGVPPSVRNSDSRVKARNAAVEGHDASESMSGGIFK